MQAKAFGILLYLLIVLIIMSLLVETKFVISLIFLIAGSVAMIMPTLNNGYKSFLAVLLWGWGSVTLFIAVYFAY